MILNNLPHHSKKSQNDINFPAETLFVIMSVHGSVCTICVCVCVFLCVWVCEFFLHWGHSAVSSFRLSMHLLWIVSDLVW